jgi:hypothetical protein
MAMDVLLDGDGRLEDGVTVTRRQWSNATVMDGTKVMDVATATAMDGLSATQRQERATVLSVAIAMAMDSLLVLRR